MNEPWSCANCAYEGDLNQQGRCGRCNSEAVVPSAKLPEKPTGRPGKPRRSKKKNRDIEELEKIYGKH